MPRYLAFYKPDEVLSQFTDAAGRHTLKEFIDIPGVYAAGRLDFRSEGLLFLSDDGPLIQRLTDPRFEHAKTYLAQVEGEASEEAVARLRQELLVPGVQERLPAAVEIVPPPALPARPRPVRGYHPTSWLRIVLQEGKKHEVRRLTAAVGLPTLRLVRVAIGSLELGSLQPGEWRRLSQAEVLALKHLAGLR